MTEWLRRMLFSPRSMTVVQMCDKIARLHNRGFGDRFISDISIHIEIEGDGYVSFDISTADGDGYSKVVPFESPEEFEAIISNPPISST